MSSNKFSRAKKEQSTSSSEDSSEPVPTKKIVKKKDASDSSKVKNKTNAPKVEKTSRKDPAPEPKSKPNKDSSSSEEEVTKVKLSKRVTPPPKRATPPPKPASSSSSDDDSKKKKASSKKKQSATKKESTSSSSIEIRQPNISQNMLDKGAWDAGTAALMKMFSKIDTDEIKSKNVREVRRNLSLNFSETPLTPPLLKKYFGKTKVGIVGINILLSNESKLEIPEVLYEQLAHIVISGDPTKLTDVSVLGECKNLQYLSLTGCSKLKDLTELGNLEYLEEVNLSGCTSLPSLRSPAKKRYYFRKSAELHVLNLSRCESLQTIDGIQGSKRLEYLNVSYCNKLESISEISSLTALTTLDAAHCTSLNKENITALNMFNNVDQVNIHKSSLDGQVRIVPREVARLTIGNFNMLSRGLEKDFFLCSGGEEKSVNWKYRGPKVFDVIAQMVQSCHVVVVEENDYFFPILSHLKETVGSNINGIFLSKTNPPKGNDPIPTVTNPRMFFLRVMLEQVKDLLDKDEIALLVEAKAAVAKGLKPFTDRMYNAVNRANKANFDQTGLYLFPTYRNTMENYYAVALSEFYGRNIDDLYIEDDGIAFYYNSNLMTPTSVTGKLMLSKMNTEEAGFGGIIGQVPVFFNKDGWLDVNFTFQDRSVTIVGAHLTSGEDEKGEAERVITAQRIISSLREIGSKTIPFLVMDSNVSPEYEVKFAKGTTLASATFEDAGFVDAIPEGEYRCFKERSPLSDQKKKRCELFFDQIDKMYYLPTTAINVPRGQTPLHEFGFLRFPPSITNEIYNIRTDPILRQEQKEFCLTKITDKTEVMYPDPNSPFHHIYPGPNSPSDHPPIAMNFILLTPLTAEENRKHISDVSDRMMLRLQEEFGDDFKEGQQTEEYFIKNKVAFGEARNVLLGMPLQSLDNETYTRVLTEKGLFQKL